jgi:hypothetical protein
MGRQLALTDHCVLCLKDVTTGPIGTAATAKQVYERNPGGGFMAVAKICRECLSSLRGGNWPSDVYAKLWSKELATERALRDAGLPEAPEIAA